MSAAALTAARILWPAFRKLLIKIGRWVARRVRRKGAMWVSGKMRKRALTFQATRLEAARRRGDKFAARFRKRQIGRWLKMSTWLADNTSRISKAIGAALNHLALADRIPLTLPGEGSI